MNLYEGQRRTIREVAGMTDEEIEKLMDYVWGGLLNLLLR